MKIVEQYLRAVGSKLPWKSRKDITEELRSLLMDQIEATYGDEPTEDEVKAAISDFGAPGKVAARYKTDRQVVAPGLTDLYFMIMAIMAGAMLIAFTTVFIVEALQEMPAGAELTKRILMVPLNAVGAWLSGVGGLTLVFIVLSRIGRRTVDLEENWKVEDLKDVQIGNRIESKIELIFTIALLFIFIVLLNLYPSIVTLAENTFVRSGLPLGHRIVIEVFRRYVGVLTVFWVSGIVIRVLILQKGEKGKSLLWAETGLSVAEALLAGIMLADRNLYADTGGWIGFKVIFFIVLVVNLAETGGGLFRMVRDRVVNSYPVSGGR